MDAPNVEVGREEAKQREALNKAFAVELKKRVKGTPWRVSNGVLFRELDGWFLSAPAAIWALRRKTQVELQCKPMSVDPIFWEVVETESNMTMPLSFRYHGAWTCSTPPLIEHELDEKNLDPREIADEALLWLSTQQEQFKSWTVLVFLDRMQTHPRANSYIATVVCTLFLLEEFVRAEKLCRDAIGRGDSCGFSIHRTSGASQTFPELALEWLKRKRTSFH